MKLTGEYVFKVYYELPDGSKIDIDRLINFSLNDNYECIRDINGGMNYFDSTLNGCLEVEYYEITNCFRKLGVIDKGNRIVNKDIVIEYLTQFDKDAEELINNKKAYIRKTKIETIIDK